MGRICVALLREVASRPIGLVMTTPPITIADDECRRAGIHLACGAFFSYVTS